MTYRFDIPFNQDGWVDPFFAFLEELYSTEPICKLTYPDSLVGCIAIRDDIDHGYSLAYRSGLAHRLNKHHRAWRLVHSTTLTVVGAGCPSNLYQPVPMSIREAKSEVAPWQLGCDPAPFFDDWCKVTWPTPALFVYPENWLVPVQTQRFVDLAAQACPKLIIITKDPLVVSNFPRELVFLIRERETREYVEQ